MTIGYLPHEFGPERPRMRLHVQGNPGDYFEIIDYDDFEVFKRIGEKLGIVFVDLEECPNYEWKP